MSETGDFLQVAGTSIAYDLRGAAVGVPLLLFGSPMDAGGFEQLAEEFPDRRVVTYDPRGAGRSPVDAGVDLLTPEQHGEDLHAIVESIGGGPVDAFATSGGAVNALAWVSAYPDDVRCVVVHEPPLTTVLPDRDAAAAAVAAMNQACQRDGFGAGMARFIAMVSHVGEFGPDFAAQPAPDPAAFGMPTEDDGSRGDPLLGLNRTCALYEPDLDALRSLGERLVPAYGAESGEILPARSAQRLAEQIGVVAVDFPGDHVGFWREPVMSPHAQPAAFAARLREVLPTAG